MSYLITPSLYNSYYYYTTLENTEKIEFLNTLNKVRTPPSETMQRGIDFEDIIFKITEGTTFNLPETLNDKDYKLAKEIAEIVKGGFWQEKLQKQQGDYLLYGRADVIKGDTIFDIKRVNNYEVGRYFPSIQHLVYMECTGIEKFRYLISDGSSVYEEYYHKDNGNLDLLMSRINGMVDFIRADKDFLPAFENNWLAKN